MNAQLYKVGPIESDVPLPARAGQTLTLDQLRVLELKDGDSFLLQTIIAHEGENVIPRIFHHSASRIASRLSGWARGRCVRLAYRVIDKNTVRIWRVGEIRGGKHGAP
jgi:hypothetical protein